MTALAFRFRAPLLGGLGFALACALAPVARADVDYWRDLLRSARDAGAVRVVEFRAQAPIRERPAEFSADILGPAADLGASGGALVWQLGGFADDEGDRAGAFGLHYRFPPSGDRAAGAGAFLDYHREKGLGHFWRWSAGGEYRSPWTDIFANYYFPMDSERVRTDAGNVVRVMQVAEGYDAEIRVHSPDLPWFSAVGGWAQWNGARDDGEDRRGLRYGIRITPSAGLWRNLRFSLVYDEARPRGQKTGAELGLHFVIGEGWSFARARDSESARRHFPPAERERRVFLREKK